MSDHVFDPEFSGKIKDLFAERFGAVQKDSALRSLRMVYKDNLLRDAEVQVNADEVDTDLLAELAWYRKEVQRLTGEVNAMTQRMMNNEKAVKQANQEKKDALITVQSIESTLNETR